MSLRIVQVDAFASRPFSGNPAAVCVLTAPRDERWMQDVACEMNLAETAFLHPENEGYRLRWFTPTIEMALCGHATLASAHVLWEEGRLPADRQARFHTQSGLLTADRRDDWIELDFPATPPAPAAAPPGLATALGGSVTPRWVGRSKFDYLVELDSEATVRALIPDPRGARTGGRSWDDRDESRHDAGLRLRITLLRATGGRAGRPCHRFRPLRRSRPSGASASSRRR